MKISTNTLPETMQQLAFENQWLEGKMSFQYGLMFRAYKLVSGSVMLFTNQNQIPKKWKNPPPKKQAVWIQFM